MKKMILTMAVILLSLIATAESYSHLSFTKGDGTTSAFSVENLHVTYTEDSVIISNALCTTAIVLDEITEMHFSNNTGQSALRGDVNADGIVGIADVTSLIDYILSGDAASVDLTAADCNMDGIIGIADVTALIDYILSGDRETGT